MKKALFLYFTGTYHTKALVDSFCEELKTHGIESDAVPILEVDGLLSLHGYDYIFFSYPIYAFQTPQPFLASLKKLSFPKESTYYVIKQSGEPFSLNNSSSHPIAKILKKQGIALRGEFHFLYPYNILFAYSPAWKERIAAYDVILLPYAMNKVINKEEHHLPYTAFTYGTAHFISFLERFGAKIDGPLFHVKKKKCTKCGLCLRSCPKHNIKNKNGYPKFSSHCVLCMRCAYRCPSDAIRIGILNPIRVNLSTAPRDSLLTRKFFQAYEKKLRTLEAKLKSVGK